MGMEKVLTQMDVSWRVLGWNVQRVLKRVEISSLHGRGWCCVLVVPIICSPVRISHQRGCQLGGEGRLQISQTTTSHLSPSFSFCGLFASSRVISPFPFINTSSFSALVELIEGVLVVHIA